MSIINSNDKRAPLPGETTKPAGARATTVLTADCEFKGALAFSGELQLHGRIEGTIESEGGSLTVGEEAMIKAEIRVNDVQIHGKVQGNVYASGRIELRGKAEVYGDLHTNRLAMDDGVIFVGRSTTLSKNQPTSDFSRMFTRLGAGSKITPMTTETESSSGSNRIEPSRAAK